jgi:hypothetical protein
MTHFQALLIKLLRCRQDYTYRAIYEFYMDRYPDTIIKGSRCQGEYLIGLAEVTLGENPGAFDIEYKQD